MSTRVRIKAHWEDGGKSPHKRTPSLLTPAPIAEDSQDHSQFWWFARRAQSTHWKLLCSWLLWFITGIGYKLKVSQEKKHIRVESGEEASTEFPLSSPVGSGRVVPNIEVLQYAQSIPTRKLTWAVVSSFYWGSITQALSTAHVADATASPLGGWAQSPPPKSHYWCGTKTVLSGWHPKDLEINSRKPEGKGQTSFWVRLNSLPHTLIKNKHTEF